MNLPQAWRSTFLTRWHKNPYLSGTNDYLHGHMGRVCLIAVELYPGETEVLEYLVVHDLAEAAEFSPGDVPQPAKARYPDVRLAVKRAEIEEALRLGIHVPELLPRAKDKAKLCDLLDAIFWAAFHEPALMREEGWKADVAEATRLMREHGLDERVEEVLGWVTVRATDIVSAPDIRLPEGWWIAPLSILSGASIVAAALLLGW